MTDETGILDALDASQQIAALLDRTQNSLVPHIPWDFMAVTEILAEGASPWGALYDHIMRAWVPSLHLASEGDRRAAAGMLIPRPRAEVEAATQALAEAHADALRVPLLEDDPSVGTRLPTPAERDEAIAAITESPLYAAPDLAHALLTWLAADSAGSELTALLAAVEEAARAAACTHITTTRFAFGVGWPGIPLLPPLEDGLRAAGWVQGERWTVWAHTEAPPPGVAMPRGVLPLTAPLVHTPGQAAYGQAWLAVREPIPPPDQMPDAAVGECQMWHLPETVRALVPDATTIEFIEVDEADRRAGIGRGLLSAALIGAHAQGYTTVLAWTTETNAAARGLLSACGFRHAFTAADWTRPL
jgi:GNAT superfamily N-acetyltransferase